jgi:Orsellinic acid/F9775 biosynthesis cluster protein D
MEQYVIYNTEHRVLICKHHKCGIGIRTFHKHLRAEHKYLSISIRKEILTYARGFSLCEPNEVPVFDAVIPPVHGLEIIDGYRCNYHGCEVLTGTVASMKRHSIEHGPTGWEGEAKYHAIKVQTFFRGHDTR